MRYLLLKSEQSNTGSWIPLMDYAMRRGVSLSTLRRYIKAGKVQYKVENGRYLLLDSQNEIMDSTAKNLVRAWRSDVPRTQSPAQEPKADSRVGQLERELRVAREEIAELKMLVALYEEKIFPQRLDS